MFLRVSKIKEGDKTYRYLRLVKNYRLGTKTKQKVVANIGNLDTLPQKDIDNLVVALSKFSKRRLYSASELSSEKDLKYGDIALVKAVWDKIDLGGIIKSCLSTKKPSFSPVLACLIMVTNRLISPQSKLSVVDWYKRIYLPEIEGTRFDYQHFYRAMDHLIPIKEKIESLLFNRLCDLFSLKVTLVFYDLTSTYFEGAECEISQFGYSRDRRPDKKQIILGLVVTKEGLPIAHEVFTGNTADKTTLEGIVKDLKKRFQIERCIFVADRGLVTQGNLDFLKKEDYQYIVALRKRQSQEALDIIDPNLSNYETMEEGLKALEVKEGNLRYLICHNLEKEQDDRKFREDALKEAQEKLEKIIQSISKGKLKRQKPIIIKTAKILLKKKTLKFFNFSFDKKGNFSYSLNPDVVAKERILDGKYILKTNVKDLTPREIISSYKNLASVERAFRTIKDFIRLRPIYHYKPLRVKAHVFICVLAYLIEKVIEKILHEAGIGLSAQSALEKLDTLRLIENKLGEQAIRCITKFDKEQKGILAAFGIKNIPRTTLIAK